MACSFLKLPNGGTAILKLPNGGTAIICGPRPREGRRVFIERRVRMGQG